MAPGNRRPARRENIGKNGEYSHGPMLDLEKPASVLQDRMREGLNFRISGGGTGVSGGKGAALAGNHLLSQGSEGTSVSGLGYPSINLVFAHGY